MKFTLPLPPSDNKRFVMNWRLRRFIASPSFNMYKKTIVNDVLYQIATKHNKKDFPLQTSFEHQLIVNIEVYLADKRRDAMNIQKCLFDTLKGTVYDDDHWIMPRFTLIAIDKNSPRIELEFIRQ